MKYERAVHATTTYGGAKDLWIQHGHGQPEGSVVINKLFFIK